MSVRGERRRVHATDGCSGLPDMHRENEKLHKLQLEQSFIMEREKEGERGQGVGVNLFRALNKPLRGKHFFEALPLRGAGEAL